MLETVEDAVITAEKTKPKLLKKQPDNLYDVIIVGSGMAGMTAALYAARAERKVLLLESKIPGGRISTTDIVENWPTYEVIKGFEIGEKLTRQIEKFGVKSEWGIVTGINKLEKIFMVSIENKKIYQGKTVIIATGVEPRKLKVPGEDKYRGRGVSYCATCDGAFYKNKEVVVIGGGDSAVKEATFLTKFAKKVTIVHRRNKLRAEKIVAKKAMDNPKLEILWDTTVEEILGEGDVLTGIKIKNVNNGVSKTYFCDGIFLYVGNKPNTEFIKDFVKLTEEGYIAAGEDTKTNVPGLFAAGDIRAKYLRQLVTAAADGGVAAMMADEYLESNFPNA